MRTIEIPLEYVYDNPWQTRQRYEDEYIAELAADVAKNGLLQAPAGRLVLESGKPAPVAHLDLITAAADAAEIFAEYKWRVQLAFGHNRLRAFRHNEVATIPIDLRTFSDEQLAILAWSENEQRRNLNPIEEALAIKRRMDDFGWNQQQVADELGLARATVSNKLRVLLLPDDRLEQVRTGELSERKAMALLPVYQLPEELQSTIVGSWQLRDEWAEPANYSSDEIRRAVKRAIDIQTLTLTKDDFLVDEDYDVDGVRQPTCGGCPMLISAAGEPDRCGDRECFSSKRAACREQRIRSYAEKSGIEIVDTREVEGQHYDRLERWNSGQETLKRAQEKECGKLKLDVAPHAWGLSPSKCDGVWTCHHGGKRCACKSAVSREENKERRERQEWIARIQEHVAEQLAHTFAAIPENVLRMLTWQRDWERREAIVAGELDVDEMARFYAKDEVSRIGSYNDRQEVDALITAIEAWAAKYGFELDVHDPESDHVDEPEAVAA